MRMGRRSRGPSAMGIVAPATSRSSGDSRMALAPRERRKATSESAQRRTWPATDSREMRRVTPSSERSSASTWPVAAADLAKRGNGISQAPLAASAAKARFGAPARARSRRASSSSSPLSARMTSMARTPGRVRRARSTASARIDRKRRWPPRALRVSSSMASTTEPGVEAAGGLRRDIQS